MTKINNKLVQRVICLLVLMMVVAGSVFEVSAQHGVAEDEEAGGPLVQRRHTGAGGYTGTTLFRPIR